jgi:hypothetical protein
VNLFTKNRPYCHLLKYLLFLLKLPVYHSSVSQRRAVLWASKLVAGITVWRLGFNPRPVLVGVLVNEVALGQDFLPAF